MENIAKQSEILFLWDGEYWNPNGDILNDNAPRYDEVSQRALVSDVRIKRTIRDYLESKGFEIFVKEQPSKKGGLADGKERVEAIVGDTKKVDVEQTLKEKCIDVRAFGGVFPVDKQTNNLTGPMQFKISKSINECEIQFIKGTGAFASSAGKENKTFREEYVLPYAIISTYGIISQLSAQKTNFSEDDVKEILNALWFGTKNLISRSKFGQLPRFLLKITYKEPGYYIGALDNLIDIETPKSSESEIRSIQDYTISIDRLLAKMEDYKDYIEKIEYALDSDLNISSAIPNNWEKREF